MPGGPGMPGGPPMKGPPGPGQPTTNQVSYNIKLALLMIIIHRVLATYLSALHSHNPAIQSATLSSDSAMLRFFQNLFTQDLNQVNAFNSERYAKENRKWPQNAPFST